jgi:hypothetical protein
MKGVDNRMLRDYGTPCVVKTLLDVSGDTGFFGSQMKTGISRKRGF